MNYWTIIILTILLIGRYVYIERANITRRITYTPYYKYNPISPMNILYKTAILGKTPFTVAKETAYEISVLQLSDAKTFVYNTFTYIPFNVAELLKKQTLFNDQFAGSLVKTVTKIWTPPMFRLQSPILEVAKIHSSKIIAFTTIAIVLMSIRALF